VVTNPRISAGSTVDTTGCAAPSRFPKSDRRSEQTLRYLTAKVISGSVWTKVRYRAFYAILRRTKTSILIASSTSAKTTVAARTPRPVRRAATSSRLHQLQGSRRSRHPSPTITPAIVRLPIRHALDDGEGSTLSVVNDIARKSPAIMRITISNGSHAVISRPNTSRSAVTIFLMIEFSV
jgi:hypothetical protein